MDERTPLRSRLPYLHRPEASPPVPRAGGGVSRKDYIAAATILREADLTPEQRDALARRFATLFADDNPRFSRTRFFEAVNGKSA